MVLFSAGATSKPAQVAQVEIENLRAELERTKAAARLRARHGPHLTDDQIDELLAEEADMVIRKAKAKDVEELNRLEEIRRDKAYRDLACELIRDGKLLVSVDGTRITEITQDLLVTCPHCGKPLGDLSESIFQYAKAWHWLPDSYQRLHAFMIYSARSPLTESGFAGYLMEPCPYCHERVMGAVQVVVI
jgi:hypothetical protein